MANQNNYLNNKRIAKNTILLYIRMIITTLVSLFATRITLQLLGAEDFGIYNVVAGIIGFMDIIKGTMNSATQRFLAYDLGKNDPVQFRKTFSMLINLFSLVSIGGVIIMEIIGPYFVSNYLVIPSERIATAQWILQFTIIGFVLETMNIPHISSIVAYEKMGIYAYFTFFDVFFKLFAVFALYITPIDKLITYGALMLIVSLIRNVIIHIYCFKKLSGCRYAKIWDTSLFKRLTSYAGWNLFGSLTTVLNHQGLTIVLNMFFGPLVNTAKAIADKINGIIFSFCLNFFMAVSPQIIKSYASGDIGYTKKLVLKSSKVSFFLMLLFASPLILNMPDLLELWLGKEQVSKNMVIFSRLTLIWTLINSLESPITQVVRATGDIKKYQIVVGLQTLLFLPLCYVALKLGMPAYSSMIILILLYMTVHISRVKIVGTIIHTKMTNYFVDVIWPVLKVSILVLICMILAHMYFEHNLIDVVLSMVTSFCVTLIIIIIIGFKKTERKYLIDLFLNKI